jgi:hypothetical protein
MGLSADEGACAIILFGRARSSTCKVIARLPRGKKMSRDKALLACLNVQTRLGGIIVFADGGSE